MIGFINALLHRNFRRSQKSFWKNSRDLKIQQQQRLSNYIRQNRDTCFGRKHHFANIRSYEDFSRAVPPSVYEDYESYVDRLIQGEQQQLSREGVTLLEPTSGSSSASKLIPYTRQLQHEFMAGVKPWLADLYTAYPNLKRGSSYWTISPVAADLHSRESRIPIGFEDDASYFGLLGHLLQGLFPVPKEIKRITSIDNFRYITSLFLLSDSSLALISLWNPSFFTLLAQYMVQHREILVRSIFDGTISWPREVSATGHWSIKQNRARAREVEKILNSGDNLEPLWPRLQLISCWTDGHSASLIPALRRYLPGTAIQPKGLLATEGIISFPVQASGGSVLAYQSHFFEFLHEGKGDILLAHQLKKGEIYIPLITTGGGLYRYNLGDLVEVTGFFGGLPMLRFLGRAYTVDLAGEKLSEFFVAGVLKEFFKGTLPDFALLAPYENQGSRGYLLYHSSRDQSLDPLVLEEILQRNFHYRYARNLGQLQQVGLRKVPTNAPQIYIGFLIRKGMRAGDIKIPALYRSLDIESCFAGSSSWISH